MTSAVAPARRAVFFDRDGVLTELVARDGKPASPRRVDEFRLAEGAADAVRRLRAAGLLVFVVTNQPDVARGLLDVRDLAMMHAILQEALGPNEVMVCPHDDVDGCDCRKPEPGMLLELARRWNVDLARSFLVGDTWKDIQAGRRAGCRTILIGRALDRDPASDAAVQGLGEAVRWIERELARGQRNHDGFRP